ncbi:hypothetical protein Sgly_1745 [Syntrophobotulus glycolicus DSM 8271]|uniref:DUF2007 domain-containing protein n=1 Tax=Syntrophobotulus glycolicus (strain DSM 8271 / FlGlyR) TaxID=645991 RepID=F0SZ05_SYNGF|nr:hypothetical protein [Syntrophobotulus glycolicus]ADY56042.1 hypothetical protein Sgly_1745 [Syntrophobotulus glycolicus DSM 8271]
MWTVIYIAQNKKLADKYMEALSSEGILVQSRQLSLSQDLSTSSYELLVPESEVEEAHEILTGLMGSR